jgi:hypothetical protein
VSTYTFPPPSALTGADADAKLAQLYSYIYRMNEQLRIALADINIENMTEETRETLIGNTGAATKKDVQTNAETLKSYIIKTANVIESEMEQLETSLASRYLARSEFGTFRESLQATIRATADAVVQSYGYSSSISDLADGIADYEDYKLTTSQYIKTGLLFYEGMVPRYGVAVGENLTTTVVNGETVLTRQDLCATFTSDRLSFWMSGVEVAYVSNAKLHINAAEIDQVDVGNWRISHTDGFTIEWTGA